MTTWSNIKQSQVIIQHTTVSVNKNALLHAFFVAIAYLGLFILFFNDILFSNSYIPSDGIIPADIKIPSWSHDIFSGYPLIADPIWHAFYLPQQLIYRGLGLDFNFFIISGYFFMAYFTYGYVYSLTRNNTAAFISGLIFSFSGYSMFEIKHAESFIHTICWLPLILLALEKLKKDYSWQWTVTAIFAVTMSIFGGFPQLSLAIFPIVITYAFFLSAQAQKEQKSKKILFYIGIIMAGYLISTPLTLPTIVLSLSSARATLSWEVFCTYYVELKQLLLFVFPYLMGGDYSVYSKISSFGNWQNVGNHGYVGFLSFILAGIGLYKSPSHLRPYIYYFLFFALLAVAVSLGPEIESFYSALYQIPVINNFRAPERYLFLFALGISILAGIGFHTVQQGLIQSSLQRKIILSCSLLFILISLFFLVSIYPTIDQLALTKTQQSLPVLYKNISVIIPLIWMVLSVLACFFWLKKPNSSWIGHLVLCILAGELLSTAYFSYGHPKFSYWTKDQITSPPTYLSELKNDLDNSHQRFLKMQISSSGIGKYLWGNYALYYNLPSAGGYSTLASLRYMELLLLSPVGLYIGDATLFGTNQAYNIAGIKYLYTVPNSFNDIWFGDKAHFQFRQQIGEDLIFENLQALPKAWFVSQVTQLPPEEIKNTIIKGKFTDGRNFEPAKTALVESPVTTPLESDSSAKVIVEEIRDNQVMLHTETQKDQFLVLNDAFFPGWNAYIDGKKSDIILTNYVFKGLIVPAGHHKVTFKFQPWYLYAGYIIASLTMLLVVVLMLRQARMQSKV